MTTERKCELIISGINIEPIIMVKNAHLKLLFLLEIILCITEIKTIAKTIAKKHLRRKITEGGMSIEDIKIT